MAPLPPAQLAVLLGTILGLAAVVAAASRPGETGPGGLAGTAVTELAILRALVILVAVAEVLVFALVGWALWPGGGRQRRIGKRRGNLAVAIASFLQAASVLVLFWVYLRQRAKFGSSGQGLFGGLQVPTSLPSVPSQAPGVAGGQEWLTALLVLAALGLAASVLLRGIRLGQRPSTLARLASRLDQVLEEGLDELAAEPDPRRAVIGAYARMERSLAGVGLPRSGPEAALEYLARLLQRLGAHSAPAQQLTDLYQLAKFSRHPIDEEMKRQAIAALVELGDQLRERAEAELIAVRARPA
jgi:hypothetical protein